MQNQEAMSPADSADTQLEDAAAGDPISEAAATLDKGAQSLSSYTVDLIEKLNLPNWLETPLSGALLLLLVSILAALIFFILRPLVAQIVARIIRKTPVKWDDSLIEFGMARWLSHVFSGALILAIVPGLFSDAPNLGKIIGIALRIYLITASMLVVNSLLNAARQVYDESSMSRVFPATSIVQVLKLLAFVVALVMVISTVAGKSPVVFLSGLGVFASVIMLVFKDAILGLVAGIQLTSNQMVNEGDWIEMEKHGADGNVVDVGLTTVKVMNFDKTITTIPTYALISESFKNWRSMPEAGGRRIKRSIHIDVNSIQICSTEMLEKFSRIELIKEYIKSRSLEIEKWNKKHSSDSKNTVNGRRLTNIGVFRVYIENYLEAHPQIHKEGMTLLVRQLQSGPDGVPIEIYCFCKKTDWVEFEGVQSDIFDHLLAVAGEFDLEVFQNPAKWGGQEKS